MTRVHPQFLMNGFKKAVEKQDFGEFNKELTNGIFSIMQMNAEEAAKAVKDVTNENVLIVLHAADSRNTVKKAAKSQAEALEPAER